MSVEKKPRIHGTMAMDSNPSNWPSDVVLEISRHVGTRRDIFHMRAVCSYWRSSIPIPLGFSLKLPFPICPNTNFEPKRRGHFLLKDSTIFCLEPLNKKTTKCWIVRVEETDSEKIRFINPLSNPKRLHNKVINLLNFRVREIDRVYLLKFVPEDGLGSYFGVSTRIKKVVAGHDRRGQFWVMVLHSWSGSVGKLGLWKMGSGKWENVGGGCFFDIAYHNWKFYASSLAGQTKVFDPLSLDVHTEIGRSCCFSFRGLYVVGLLGNLLGLQLLRREPDPSAESAAGFDSEDYKPYFKVYKLDEKSCRWKHVEHLEKQLIFVGDDSSYAVSATDFAAFKGKGNSILFRDGYFERSNFPVRPICCSGIYNLQTHGSWSFGYSNIFWPPPKWLLAEENN